MKADVAAAGLGVLDVGLALRMRAAGRRVSALLLALGGAAALGLAAWLVYLRLAV